jgi:hypothetical protein
MPDQDTVQMQDQKGKLWNVPRTRVPEAMQRGAKVYSLPSQTSIRPPSWGEKAESDVVSGMGLDPAEVKGEGTADFIRNMASGTGQWAASTLKDPYHITDPIEFMANNLEQALKEKNPAKIVGALSSVVMGMEGMEKGPKIASAAARPPVAWLTGLGKSGAKVEGAKVAGEATNIAKENQSSLAAARDTERQSFGKVAEENAKKMQEHQTAMEETRKTNQQNLAKARDIHEKEVAAAADTQAQLAERQRLGSESRKHATDLSNGLLQDLRDKANAEAKAAYGEINGNVKSEDINGDIRSSVNEGLKGSGRTPAILERLLVESSPVKGPTTPVRALTANELKASNLAGRMIKEGSSPAETSAAMVRLGYTPSQVKAIVSVASGAEITEDTAGPAYNFEKLHGIYSELGRELFRRDLPGDEYTTIKTARDKVLDRMRNLATTDDPSGEKLANFEVAQAGYSQFQNTFWNDGPLAKGGSPVAKALATYDTITKHLRPAYVQQILSDTKAHELAQEMLGRYKHLGAPTDIVQDMKAKWDASREPVKVKPAPTSARISLKETPEAPELAKGPTSTPINLKETPKFDPTEWRMKEMTRRAEQFRNPSRFEAPLSKLGPLRSIYFRTMSELYSNPAFRKWIAGIK